MSRVTGRSRIHELSAEELAIYRQLDPEQLPKHIAIIMDGNGRWAGQRRLQRFFGHQQGAESVQYVVETASRIDLPWLTLYAFSLENNLRRPETEVSFLMRLLRTYLVNNVKRMNDNNVRIAYIGRVKDLPQEVQETMQWAAEQTVRNTGTTLTLALNYGARVEIVDAVRDALSKIAAEQSGPLPLADLLSKFDEQHISRALYTAHMPDPDLVIRTSGEMRISNFLLWQIAYSEIYVTERFWPDFRGKHFLEAIREYQCRERRFGGLGSARPGPNEKPVEPEQLLAR
ncbi:MAG TPA: isoprenyl transferase [Acidobacteriaceae bacterium]|nr:isoprenyl transferase [Acidobacteriaceae bacterium]